MQAFRGTVLRTPRAEPAPRLRSSARAIRAALLATGTALAMGGALPAWAGDCVLTVTTIECNGAFETPSPDPSLDFVGDDLTVVFGADAPSSVLAGGVDGIAVQAPTASASLANYGDVASTGGGDAQAIDMQAYGNIYFDNFGSASAQLYPGGGAPYDVVAVDLYSNAGSVWGQNAAGAEITAIAEADYGYTIARGVVAIGENAYFDNYGSIVVSAAADIGNVVAVGVQETGTFATLYNEVDASILVSAESGQGIDYGADAWSAGAFVSGVSAYVSNAGTIAAQSTVHGGEGIATAIGTQAYGIYGFATTTNYGSISAYAFDDSDEASYSFAYGVIDTTFYLQGVASASNYGAISAHAHTYFGAAIAYAVQNAALYAATTNAGGAGILAIAEVDYAGLAIAVGVEDYGMYYAHAVNAGSIYAHASSNFTDHYGRFTYASASATGVIEDSRYFGGAVVENSGDITAVASSQGAPDFFQGGASATGVYENGKYYTAVANSGDIGAHAYAEIGIAVAFGIQMRSKYGATTYVGNAEGATIVAEAHAGSASGDYIGGHALADAVRMFSGSYAQLYNDGTIYASATVDANDRDYFDGVSMGALAYGSYQRGQYGATLRNAGDMYAVADADFSVARAYGAWMRGYYYAVTYNEGQITAIAQADDGEALAVGNYLDAPGQHFCTSYGPYGCYGYTDYGGLAALENDGGIQAHAGAANGIATAYGVVVIGELHAQAANRGDVLAVAEAEGGDAQAVALLLRSDQGDAWLDNAEGASIVAAAYGSEASATALLLATRDYAQVDNAGVIVAIGDGERIAIDARLSAGVEVRNEGLVAGSILGGYGDDAILNYGTILLADASIDLGYHGAYGNRFSNYDTLRIEGSSEVDMGSGPQALAAAPNPYAFYNYGVIEFRDGQADDLLAIVGDFAGVGSIGVDVDVAAGTSDQLAIDGSVAAGATTAIDVALSGAPVAGNWSIPIVSVTGDSLVSNFTLAEAELDAGFLALDLSLVADIDAGNARPDVFAIGIEVTGLSDAGTLAASVAPSVLGLAATQVGTWRQRMGVLDADRRDAVSAWARVLHDKGGHSPTQAAANFGAGGNFDWEQENSGAEIGLDFALTDAVSLGLLFAKLDAGTHLEQGDGSAKLEAEGFGLYATWISPRGWYLDASWRGLSFDAELRSTLGPMASSGNADTLNLEAGRTWTFASGLALEPQLQYTRSRVHDMVAMQLGGESFQALEAGASRARVGMSLRKRFGDAAHGWQWTPYASLGIVHEFDGENRYLLDSTLSGESSLAGSSALLELGITASHANWSVHGGLDWRDGGTLEGVFGGQLTLRYNFGAAQ
jgi:outer membrane autotransporter protein